MTTVPQFAPVDPATGAFLDTLAADWRPYVERDRNLIARVIRNDALAHGGHVSPNRVRAALAALPVAEQPKPQRVGCVYRSLSLAGLLVADGFELSDDLGSRNRGKPGRTYVWKGGSS